MTHAGMAAFIVMPTLLPGQANLAGKPVTPSPKGFNTRLDYINKSRYGNFFVAISIKNEF